MILPLPSGVLRRGPRRVVVYAFFDDSLSFRGNGLILMAGYVSDDAGWASFATEWPRVLERHGLRWLHTSDFLNQSGDYRGMRLSEERRIEVIRDFIGVTRKHVHAGFGVGLDAKAFKELTASSPKAERLGKRTRDSLLATMA